MFTHPYLNLEISRQREQVILGEREQDRIAKIVLADSRQPKKAVSHPRPFPTIRAWRPHRASA
jgi:hypothetical protein